MKKAFVFDFDDTLATTDCRVLVRTDNSTRFVRRRLTPAEFNTDTLGTEEVYDFSEFRSEKFIRSANPTFLMALAQEVHNEGHSVFVLTARADNVATTISDWLCGFGVKPVRVHCVGSDTEKVDIAAEKKRVLKVISETHDLVYFYDDDQHNIDSCQWLSGLKTYLV